VIRDAEDRPHDWRAELCERLIALQKPDGSWVNANDRFAEGDPHLVTAYAILAMQTALE
jgi:squalene-hopene/tetraprenyl-beta-curcumene cyclase